MSHLTRHLAHQRFNLAFVICDSSSGTNDRSLSSLWGATPDDSAKILGAFLERGGNFVDTANFYTRGHSEKIIGDFIAQDRARRERMVLATKFFNNLYPGDPNGGARVERRSLPSVSSRSVACRPTTSTSTGSI